MTSEASAPSNPDGITGRLCMWIHNVKYTDIPQEVMVRAKELILDGIACAVVGSHLPWSETAANAIYKMESPGPCTVVGWGDRKLSPLAAAITNGTFIQGFELDDYHSRAPLHSNSILLPALFAAIEGSTEHHPISGRDFLRAYVVGCEVGPRVGLALHGGDLLSRGWHSGAVQGPSASSAAVSALLGLNPAQIESALGIACTQACGLMSAQFGSMVKRMQHGFASRNGLFGALLAKEDYTGISNVYETPYGGFLSCFGQGANFEPKTLPEQLNKDLGSKWEIFDIRVKLHAAMAALHGTIECIENLQKAHPERFDKDRLANIDRIVTRHGKAAFEHGGWIAPPSKPMTATAAQMSIQYAAAAQLLDRQVLMQQYGASTLNRPAIRDLMSKVHPEHDTSIDENQDTLFTTKMEVHFRDGTMLEYSLQAAKGINPPASREDIVEKWRLLVKDVLDDARRDEIEEKVFGLESLTDLKELIQLLAAQVKCPIEV